MLISNTSERLKDIMKTRNLRQIDILNLCLPYCEKHNIKMGRNHISQYVSGKVQPNQEKLSILAMALNVSEAWLMGYDVMSNYFMENIKFIRRKNQMTQEQFGKKLDKAISTISAWENGDRSPIISDVILIGQKFGYEPADILFVDLTSEDREFYKKFNKLFSSLSDEQQEAIIRTMKAMKGEK